MPIHNILFIQLNSFMKRLNYNYVCTDVLEFDI